MFFYLLDDFHSSGHISGNRRIPLAKLVKGKKYVVEGRPTEVDLLRNSDRPGVGQPIRPRSSDEAAN